MKNIMDQDWVIIELPEAGSALPEAGSALPEAGSALPEAGSALPEAGSALPEAGSAWPENDYVMVEDVQATTPDYLYAPRTEWILIDDGDEIIDFSRLHKRWSWSKN
jgi:hypothetical protein